jgi:hypothetical protein
VTPLLHTAPRETFYTKLTAAVEHFAEAFVPASVQQFDDFHFWKDGCRPHREDERAVMQRVYKMFLEWHRWEPRPQQFAAVMGQLIRVRVKAVARFPEEQQQ